MNILKIIKEELYDFEWLLNSKYNVPEYLSKLKKRRTDSHKYGYGYKYSNPKSHGTIFHHIPERFGSVVTFGDNGRPTIVKKTFEDTLYVNYEVYDELKNDYGFNDQDILYWFNTLYKSNAKKLIRGIRDWR